MLRRPFESSLAALVRMMNHGGGTALAEGHVERLEHQFRTQMGLHRPAHDAPAESVEHYRQVEKARPSRDVGDVGDPQTIRAPRRRSCARPDPAPAARYDHAR